MGDVTIRDARDDELDQVADLLEAAYAQYGPPPESSVELAEAFDEYRTNIRDVRSRLNESVLIVAEQDGRIVGSVTFYPPSSEGTGEGWPAGWAAFRLLGVDPSARGAGIGRALTEECLCRARALGATTMGLHTTVVMDVARAMYERMGFTRYAQNDMPITDDFTVMAYRMTL
ncbi:MAG: GNAT family N-acetyltransferase [Actinomycetota bacterium]